MLKHHSGLMSKSCILTLKTGWRNGETGLSYTSPSITACCILVQLVNFSFEREHFHTNLYSSQLCHKHETASNDLSNFHTTTAILLSKKGYYAVIKSSHQENGNQVCSNSTRDPLDDPPAGGTKTGPVAISFLARQGLGDFSQSRRIQTPNWVCRIDYLQPNRVHGTDLDLANSRSPKL